MREKSVSVLNPYEALKETTEKESEVKEVGRIRWFFMSKFKKLMYSMPIFHRNEQRLHLENGYILNFETMTIEVEKY